MPITAVAPSQTLLSTSFTIQPTDVTGTQITFNYDTMPGNQPNTYGNTVYLWQTSTAAIPINTAPQSSQVISANQPNGSSVFMGLNVTEEAYLVAYAVGSTTGAAPASTPLSIVAAILIPATGGGTASPNSITQGAPQIQVTNLGSTSVSFSYSMPAGMQPQSNGDWVGLWQGQGEAVLYSVAPTWSTQLGSNANSGNWALNLSSGGIQRGTTYTLGYFKGGYAATSPKQTTLACSTTFTG